MKQLVVEKQLASRLKLMGVILLLFAIITIIWDFFPSAENELDQILLEIEETPPPMNPYLVSSAFTLVGSSCLLVYWRKKKLF